MALSREFLSPDVSIFHIFAIDFVISNHPLAFGGL